MRIKDRIKLYVFPKLALFLNKIGFSWEYLGKTVLNKSIMLAQAYSIGKFNIDKSKPSQNIYVLLMLSSSTFHLFIESLLALGLKKKGHNVTFIIDDNTLPIHELKIIGDEENWDYQTEIGYIYASKFLKNLGLDFIPISQFIEVKGLKFDIRFNSILEASLLKQYRVGVITDKLPNIALKTTQLRQAIAMTTEIGVKLVEIKPDKVIMSHGIYSTWGPPFEVLNENNIPILVHGRGKKRHSQVYNWNKTIDTWDVSQEWEKLKNRDLTDMESSELNQYLDSRITHKDDVFVYNLGQETSKNETIKNLGLNVNLPIYTLFTNVLWDAASAQREVAFKNPVEWVIETITWFNKFPQLQLVVKIHPAEIVLGTKMPFYDIIMSRVKPNDNIKIIKPEAKVNSWSIYEISDLGIVHTTTSGMELPLVNKPCVVVSKTHYRNKGFTIDVNSKEEYFKVLQEFNISSIDYKENKKQALKYAYLSFVKYQVPFNMFFEENSTDIKGFRKETMDDYFNIDMFKKIIQSIEDSNNIFKL